MSTAVEAPGHLIHRARLSQVLLLLPVSWAGLDFGYSIPHPVVFNHATIYSCTLYPTSSPQQPQSLVGSLPVIVCSPLLVRYGLIGMGGCRYSI